MTVCMDGEVFTDTSVKMRVVPGAVRIVAPNGMKYYQRANGRSYGDAFETDRQTTQPG
jgi:hypothetical protein